MSELEAIRELIGKNEIDRAIKSLATIVPPTFEDEFLLLKASFHGWNEHSIMGLNPAEEIKNKIIYGILKLIRKIEKVNQNGFKAFQDKSLLRFEEQLSDAYGLLSKLIEDEQDLDQVFQQVVELTGKRTTVIIKKTVEQSELEILLRKQIKRYERLYKILTANSVLFVIGTLLSPFFINSDNLFEEILDRFSFNTDDSGDEDGEVDGD